MSIEAYSLWHVPALHPGQKARSSPQTFLYVFQVMQKVRYAWNTCAQSLLETELAICFCFLGALLGALRAREWYTKVKAASERSTKWITRYRAASG